MVSAYGEARMAHGKSVVVRAIETEVERPLKSESQCLTVQPVASARAPPAGQATQVNMSVWRHYAHRSRMLPLALLVVVAKEVVHPERSEKNGVSTQPFSSEENPV